MTLEPRVVLLLAAGVAAVIQDIRTREISNWTSGGAFVGGLMVQTWQAGWSGLGEALAGAALGFGVFLVFYLLGGRGAGDVKLMAGFGALLGFRPTVNALVLSAICGGIVAVGYLAWRKTARWWKVPVEGGDVWAPIPYAPAITAGAWLALWAGM